jgi:hypothetical protein
MGSDVGLNTIARPYQSHSNLTNMTTKQSTFDIIGVWINMQITID